MGKTQDLFERFAGELTGFLRTAGPSEVLDDDLQFGLELQRERLKDRGLEMSYTFTPRGHFAEGGHGRHWSDGKYASTMQWRTCRWDRALLSGEETVYRDGEDKILYMTMNDLADRSATGEDEPYRCPNCGNLTTVGGIRKGCPYCGTHFEMEDLFPRISSYYFVKEFGGTEQEVKAQVLKYVIPFAAVGAVLAVMSGLLSLKEQHPVVVILQTLLMIAFMGGGGAFFGYMIWAVGKLAVLFREAGKSIGLLINVGGSRKRFETAMQRYSPAFSYEYFVNKAASLARMIIFSEDPSALPVYVGEKKENPFSDVLDAQFRGPAALRSFRTDGDFVVARTTVYFENLVQQNGRPVRRNQSVTMELRKNVMLPFRQGYSIRKVSCSGCGGSFDATRRNVCPFCGTRYRIQDEDWFVTDFKKD